MGSPTPAPKPKNLGSVHPIKTSKDDLDSPPKEDVDLFPDFPSFIAAMIDDSAKDQGSEDWVPSYRTLPGALSQSEERDRISMQDRDDRISWYEGDVFVPEEDSPDQLPIQVVEEEKPDLAQRQEAKEQERFVQWFQDSWLREVRNPVTRKKLKRNHYLALTALVNLMSFGNQVTPTQRVIADGLGLTEQKLSNLINDLEEMNFITRNSGTAREFTLMVNPEFFLMGSREKWSTFQSLYEELRTRRMAAKAKRETDPRPSK